jgi:hypothetical protein
VGRDGRADTEPRVTEERRRVISVVEVFPFVPTM